MPAQEFRKWRQKTLLGVSLKVVAPTGQYDPTKLVNWGTNRWALKPDFGYSERWGIGFSIPMRECGSTRPIRVLFTPDSQAANGTTHWRL